MLLKAGKHGYEASGLPWGEQGEPREAPSNPRVLSFHGQEGSSDHHGTEIPFWAVLWGRSPP